VPLLNEIRPAKKRIRKNAKILNVSTIYGEYFEFSKNVPGRIQQDKIIGTAISMVKRVEISISDIKQIIHDNRENVSKIISNDGKIYNVKKGTHKEIEDKAVFFIFSDSLEPVSINLAVVKSIQYKKEAKTGFIVVGVVLVAITVVALLSFEGPDVPMSWW
jgi:hypothetical protein